MTLYPPKYLQSGYFNSVFSTDTSLWKKTLSASFGKHPVNALFLYVLLSLVGFSTMGQQYERLTIPDSIQALLDTTANQPKFLYDVARSMERNQPALAYSLYYEGIKIAGAIGDFEEVMYGHKELGYFFIPINRDSSFYHLNTSLSVAEANDDLGQKKRINGSLGTEYFAVGQYNKALNYHLSAYDYAWEQGDTVRVILYMNRIGADYGAIGLIDSLTRYFQGAVQLALSIGDSTSASDATGNLAIQYSKEGQLEKSLEYFQKSRVLLRSDQYPRLGNSMINNAGTLKKLGKLDESLADLMKAMDISEHFDQIMKSYLYHQLASVYLEMKELDQALEYNMKSQDMAESMGVAHLNIQNNIVLSRILARLERYPEALEKINQAIRVAEETEQLEAIVESYDLKAELSYQLGEYKLSADATMKSREWTELINKEETRKLLNEMDSRFQLTQKENQNQILTNQAALKEKTITQQQSLILIVVAGLFIVAFLLYKQYKSRILVEHQKGQIESQSKKLQAMDQYKSRFFANVSHDLRTPLMLMQGNIQKIEYGGDHLNEQDLQCLNKLQMSVDKMTHLTNEISDLILLQDNQLVLQKQEVIIGSYFERMVSLFHSAAEMKGISMSWNIEVDPLLKAHIDPHQFEKIVYNLIGNALKFSEPGDSVHTSIKQLGKGELQFEVTDTGQGISEEKVEYIFNRFYQVSEGVYAMDEGMGIGLALVLELVQLHDGKIEVTSELGEGTTFLVTFPQNLDKPANQKIKYFSGGSVSSYLPDQGESIKSPTVDLKENVKRNKSAKVVLIVDDHPEIRQYLKELLDDEYIIRMASDGTEALTLLHKERIDLVITDLMMPLMDGHELIKNIKTDDAFRDTPILVLSARTTSEDLMNVLNKGINDFLAKPFKAEELKQRIKNMIDQSGSGSTSLEELVDKNYWTDVEKEYVSKINAAILDRVDDNTFSVQDLSEVLISSTRSTFTMMQKLTGMTPKQYIRSVRFQYAEELMRKRKVGSVSETAAAIGMKNPTHFSNQFEKVIGRKPSEYFEQGQVA